MMPKNKAETTLYLLAKKHVVSENLGLTGQHLEPAASTIPVKRAIANGTP